MSVVISSKFKEVAYLDNLGVQFVFDGANPLGSFDVWVSIDKENWVPITLTPAPVALGAPDTIFINLQSLAAPYIMLTFTPSVGSVGSLTAYLTGKAI